METKKVLLKFHKGIVNQPIMYNLVKKFDISFNLLKGQIDQDQRGELFVELQGPKEIFSEGLKYLRDQGIKIESLKIRKNEDKCVHCSECVPLCPTNALYIKNRETMEVGFDKEKCIACEACLKVCPFKAMEIRL